ncbi:histone-fold-containing protein [Dendrothele bispora CBS 962.96]|uniref:Histone H2A n=1 Tax=Dendrothele bispora (strain CBS 962.96) TaxID=1314807 RepID=A0A4S8MUW2_DENBC|nr:histone-fold-containing protein [Dendrothele bispora CBS 962.96]
MSTLPFTFLGLPHVKSPWPLSCSVSTPFSPTTDSSGDQSVEAGLQFPVGRVHHLLKKGNHTQRVRAVPLVYLAAVLKYLAAEILELADNAARDNKKQCIVRCHLQLAIRNDSECLLGDVFISEDSVVPQIESQLLPTRSGKGKKNEDLSQEV